MTTRRVGSSLRRPEALQQVSFLELFFDLAFVVALFQLTHGLLRELRWSGALQTLVLLLTVWLVWFTTALITDWFDPRRQLVQVIVLATLVGSLVMAAALPEAFGRAGITFTGAFIAIQFGRPILALILGRGALSRDLTRALFWAAASAPPWIAGALLHGTARGVLWAFAVAVEYTAVEFGYPGNAIMIGSAEEITEKILDAHRLLGIDRFYGQFDWGGLPRHLIEESIHRLATEIAATVRASTTTLTSTGGQ